MTQKILEQKIIGPSDYFELHSDNERLREINKELVAALERIEHLCPEITHTGGISESDEWTGDHKHLVRCVGQYARAALAKARGEGKT